MGHVSLLASGFGGYAGLARLVLLTFGFLGVGGAGVALLFMSSQKRWVPWAYGVVVVALGAFQLLLYKDGAWYQWMIEPVTRRQESLGWTFIFS